MGTKTFVKQPFTRSQIDYEVNAQREINPTVAQMMQQLLDVNDELEGRLTARRMASGLRSV